jgi:hypothetical protein
LRSNKEHLSQKIRFPTVKPIKKLSPNRVGDWGIRFSRNKSMMTQTKIEGKFYPLTPLEFLEINQLLKDAELRVYLYLVTNHPWSERKVETDTALIAEHLGLTRRTIQRAINRLEKLELILQDKALEELEIPLDGQVRKAIALHPKLAEWFEYHSRWQAFLKILAALSGVIMCYPNILNLVSTDLSLYSTGENHDY